MLKAIFDFLPELFHRNTWAWKIFSIERSRWQISDELLQHLRRFSDKKKTQKKSGKLKDGNYDKTSLINQIVAVCCIVVSDADQRSLRYNLFCFPLTLFVSFSLSLTWDNLGLSFLSLFLPSSVLNCTSYVWIEQSYLISIKHDL